MCRCAIDILDVHIDSNNEVDSRVHRPLQYATYFGEHSRGALGHSSTETNIVLSAKKSTTFRNNKVTTGAHPSICGA